MLFYSYRLLIVMLLFGIFTAKLLVAVLPVCFSLQRMTVKSLMLDLEEEHAAESETKDVLKKIEYKSTDIYPYCLFIPLVQEYGITNSFIEHFKRYINPYYPLVPTPPPNPVLPKLC